MRSRRATLISDFSRAGWRTVAVMPEITQAWPEGRFFGFDRIYASGDLGYHGLPIPGLLPGFGHVGLGGCFGWAIPESGLAFAMVHNRLLTPLLVSDQPGFVATAALVRAGAGEARKRGFAAVEEFGAPYPSIQAGAEAV